MKLEELAHLPILNEGQSKRAVVKEYAKITILIPFDLGGKVTDVYQVLGRGSIGRVPKELSPILYIRRHNLDTSNLDITMVYREFIDRIVEYQPLVPKEK